jgi:hypothetical protein
MGVELNGEPSRGQGATNGPTDAAAAATFQMAEVAVSRQMFADRMADRRLQYQLRAP